MSEQEVFIAYPSSPTALRQTISQAVESVNHYSRSSATFTTWEDIGVAGYFLGEQVIEKIDATDVFIADITTPNFNVSYEIGYAIGAGKPIYLTLNAAYEPPEPLLRSVGIFDTIGYGSYQNASELAEHFRAALSKDPRNLTAELNNSAPVFIVEPRYKTDWARRLISRVKKARLFYRSFDPAEQSRLSAHAAIDDVAQSHGVIVQLLSTDLKDHEIHNMRGAFVAGLAHGMNKVLTIVQPHDSDPIPLDYRDLVEAFNHPNRLDEIVADFAARVSESLQAGITIELPEPATVLEALDLGASAAENELRQLRDYYLQTDAFRRTLRGEARLVVGRKGSGKTAVFLQVRDRVRADKDNLVLDLKPDGYKLLKFKEAVVDLLQRGAFEHTVMAIWEYVLLLEICHRGLEADRDRHLHDHYLYDAYGSLREAYRKSAYGGGGRLLGTDVEIARYGSR